MEGYTKTEQATFFIDEEEEEEEELPSKVKSHPFVVLQEEEFDEDE
jgi:hypothetical protein